ncbi:MAG TPA: prolyl oligopeptidase family serine peptidase, partial [Agromyces sp.]
DVENIDPDRVGLLGHSLGGLLSLDAAVIAPEAADLVVALAAPSSDLAGAVTSAIEPGSEGWQLLESTVGTPDDNPDYWRDISPASFFDRAEAPLLLIHGTEDDVAPSAWAQQTADAWTAAGGQAEAVILDGADHHLEPRRDEAAGIMVAAFDAVLG